MANNTAFLSLNEHASYRRAVVEYFANLPILDGRVLQCHYSEKKDPTTIALEMGLSKNHVARILSRAEDFSAILKASIAPVAGFAPFPN